MTRASIGANAMSDDPIHWQDLLGDKGAFLDKPKLPVYNIYIV